MSDMDIFYGTWRVRDDITLEQYNDWEWLDDYTDSNSDCLFSDGYRVYSAEPIKQLNQYGFSLSIPDDIPNQVICYWYNGGATLSEVLLAVLKDKLEESDE